MSCHAALLCLSPCQAQHSCHVTGHVGLTRDHADPALVRTGLYRGYSVTLMRDVPSYGLYFVAYQVVTRWAQSLSNPLPAASIPLLAGEENTKGVWHLSHGGQWVSSIHVVSCTCHSWTLTAGMTVT